MTNLQNNNNSAEYSLFVAYYYVLICETFKDAEHRSALPGLKCLRTIRNLQERMVMNIEPGYYFIDTMTF
uniref:Uncharacterized protein n=1 Tax=Setaria digitata TaxID=48799 RepID=A0A915Q513_9BILA